MRLTYNFIGIKAQDYLYHEHLVNLHSQCSNSEFDLIRCCTNLHSSQDVIQNICLYYDVHIIMNVTHKKAN